MRLTYTFLCGLVLLSMLYISCARIVKPPGGPKDEVSPTVLMSSPEHKSVSFQGDKIIVEFDEFIRIDNLESELVISPMMDPKPDVFMRGKKMIIKLNAPLKEDRTYNFSFGDALKDITEGNPLTGFEYTVATGAVLDSLSISGTVFDAFTGENKENIWLQLYTSPIDSLFKTEKPEYIAKTRLEGQFGFSALPAGTYYLYALDDQNSNYIYDLPNETIAFLEKPISIDTSNVYNLLLKSYIEQDEKINVMGIKQSGYGSFTVNYSKPVENSDISLTGNTDVLRERHPNGDKDILWINNIEDSSAQVIITGPELNTDSSKLVFEKKYDKAPDSLYYVVENSKQLGSSAKVNADSAILVYFNLPLQDIGALEVYDSDTNKVQINSIEKGTNPRSIRLSANIDPDERYMIVITESPTDIYGNSIEQLDTINIQSLGEDDYAKLIINAENYDSTAHYVAGLYYDLEDRSIYKSFPLDSDSVVLDQLKSGRYTLLVYDDRNLNGQWDKGDLNTYSTPESTWKLAKASSLKPKFDTEVTIDLSE